jgi:hypothetical protein
VLYPGARAPTYPRPPKPHIDSTSPIYILFCTFYDVPPETPPYTMSNQDPPPPYFSIHHLLSAHSETPPVYGTLTHKTHGILFRVVHCMTFSGGVAFSLSSATPLFPFTFPPSCCYTHAFTASLKPDAAPHARYKNRTH